MAVGDQIKNLFTFRHGTQLVDMPESTALAVGAWDDLPPCNADYRRALASVNGGEGVADTVAVCRKEADDTYAWSTVGATETSVYLNTTGDFTALDGPGFGLTGFYHGSGKPPFYLAPYSEIRIRTEVTAAGSAGSIFFGEYSLDDSTYETLTTNAIDLTSATEQTTDWEPIPAGAKDWVFLRVWAEGGDEIENPMSGRILFDVRA